MGAGVRRAPRTELDDTPLLEWLERLSGKRTVERLWKPLLDSKFDGQAYEELPATYIWARSAPHDHRPRPRDGREVMGWLEGGYQTMIEALEAKLRSLGAEIHAGMQIDEITGSPDGATGLLVEGRTRSFDSVLCTLAPPLVQRVLSPELAAAVPDSHCRFLGVICVLLRTSRSVSPYYTLNITDRRVPLTTVVETTHVVDPELVGGSLLYATKYVDPSNPDIERTDEELARDYLGHVRTIFPGLRDDEILSTVVQRARVVEPVHPARRSAFASGHVPGPRAGACLDGARLPGSRERAGGYRRR